jgi:glutamate synthase (NADPH/NADH) small chain
MGDIKGFLKVKRKASVYRPVCERLKDYREVGVIPVALHSEEQASRCMDCGTPFCHWGCPIGNYIPEWNDLVFHKHWEKAFQLLLATNNLPEITGRICPAPCEYACVLGINDDPVTIRENELAIIEYAFKHNIIKPNPPKKRTKKSIAVVGSGPAGWSCADQLNKAGHKVVVFERDDKIGGIMRYGIPDFKLEKWVLDRRIKILQKEGIEFKTDCLVGEVYPISKLKKEFDVICLACGCAEPRDLKIEGRDLRGIYFAMDYLIQSNRRIAGVRHKTSAGIRQSSVTDEKIASDELIDAKDKKVVVIGGGDTGADCVGVAHRQGASCVVQIELLPKPPECRTSDFPWPKYPMLLKFSTSHEEGGERVWTVLTKKFIGENGRVKKLSCARVDFSQKDESGCPIMKEIPGTEFEIEADLVILALGFLYPQKKPIIEELNLKLDSPGNVKTGPDFMTSVKDIFSCGDMHRGQSLIVWAISEGRRAAHFIDKYLMGRSNLPAI